MFEICKKIRYFSLTPSNKMLSEVKHQQLCQLGILSGQALTADDVALLPVKSDFITLSGFITQLLAWVLTGDACTGFGILGSFQHIKIGVRVRLNIEKRPFKGITVRPILWLWQQTESV